jgi:uncharacterized protein YutE (UPF0331/DUF86 family)
MTDSRLVGKRLAFIETSVRKLREVPLERFDTDEYAQGYVLYTLQMAIHAAIDVALHIISDERAGEPKSYGDTFMLLAQRRIIPAELAAQLKRMAGMRNIIAHVYADIELPEVRDAVENRLGDLLTFVSLIRPLL